MNCEKCDLEMRLIERPQLRKHVGKHVCYVCENIQ